ncbi:hypothetical protein K438DRAFT_1779260 [Mycena galopus ATCC 62051]|nr:hypothetical protein K438DRAFT_1779260 [Mycena galopus ATCC 62051]
MNGFNGNKSVCQREFKEDEEKRNMGTFIQAACCPNAGSLHAVHMDSSLFNFSCHIYQYVARAKRRHVLFLVVHRSTKDGVPSSGAAANRDEKCRDTEIIGNEWGLIAHQCISRTSDAFAISRTL